MTPDAVARREWRRFTPTERLARYAVYLAIVTAIVVSIRTVEVIPEFVLDAPEQIADLFRRMWPPDAAYYPEGIHAALLDSIHIASVGTALGIAMALPFGFLSARNVTPIAWLNWLARFVLVAARSINTLVFALLFVAIFGPGALAGTLAIAFHSIGFLGRLFSEALEVASPGPIEALRAAGAPWASLVVYGYWPQVAPAFWALVLFRWDINVRESIVLGLVGAGGIGMALDTALNLFQWTRVAMVLVAILAVVVVAEVAVTYIRKKII
ncbi:MAG TPA: phosphonate ABC transporter, permease protein PhnE [Burkholderiales bacterium]|nr:phosphonate ABC transporter, permease protein PhnE [Burkholderiales bacterium]